MDRNSVIGFVLIFLIMIGFGFYSNKKQAEQQSYQAQLDSIASLTRVLEPNGTVDTLSVVPVDTLLFQKETPATYKDNCLELASKAESRIVVLENEKLRIEFSSLGARPSSVLIKNYFKYDSTDLYILEPGKSDYSVNVYTGEYIQTRNFSFQLASKTDTSVVFKLPFSNGGYIEQSYCLPADSYMVQNQLSFVGMQGVIPRNVNNFDIDFELTVPRMEKGFKNESQYSKLDFYFDGDKKPTEIGRGRSSSKRIDSKLSWVAFQQQFFSAIFRAKDQFANGEVAVDFFSPDDPDRNLMHCSARMRCDLRMGDEVKVPFEFYFGPNHFQTLKSYNQKYEKIIPLGGNVVGLITRVAIIPMFNFFHRFFSSYGLIILLMTLVIKTVVFPLTYKSLASSAKMQALKPEIEKINARYPKQDDAMKKQQATMDLYKRANVSMTGGCLPMLLTFPVLWAMFRFFPASIELRQQSFLWCHDLSTYDSIIDYGTRIPIFGDHLSLFALLMAIVMWVYSKMTTANQAASNDPNAQSMKFMSLWMMPIMMFFICNNLSAALSYYYLLSQLVQIVQTWFIKKYMVNPEEVLALARANEGKPTKKSKWQLRLEEAQKMQQQQQKQQRRR